MAKAKSRRIGLLIVGIFYGIALSGLICSLALSLSGGEDKAVSTARNIGMVLMLAVEFPVSTAGPP